MASLGDPVDHLVEDRAMDIKPRAGAAALAVIEENRLGRAGNGVLQIGVGEDDVRALAAQLQRDLAESFGRGLHDQLADFRRAGEGDLIDARSERPARPRPSRRSR